MIDALEDVRPRLAEEFNAAVRCAHLYAPDVFPDGPYVDIDNYKKLNKYKDNVYRRVLDALPPLQPSESMGGPREVNPKMIVFDDLEAVACFKGDEGDASFVWDLKHHSALESVTIDRTDMRIHLSQPVRTRFNLGWWSYAKISAQEFVYHALEGNPTIEGYVVVPYDQTQKDIRVANLMYVRGQGKNFKPATPVPLRSHFDVGLPFLPRGVSIYQSNPREQPNRFEFHVRPPTSFLRLDGSLPPGSSNNHPRKITAYAHTSREVFRNTVVPLLVEADPEFEHKNDKYQRLLVEFYTMWESRS